MRLCATSIKSCILHTFVVLILVLSFALACFGWLARSLFVAHSVSISYLLTSISTCHLYCQFCKYCVYWQRMKETNYSCNRTRAREKWMANGWIAKTRNAYKPGPLMITIFNCGLNAPTHYNNVMAVNSDKIKHHLCLHIISARARRWTKIKKKNEANEQQQRGTQFNDVDVDVDDESERNERRERKNAHKTFFFIFLSSCHSRSLSLWLWMCRYHCSSSMGVRVFGRMLSLARSLISATTSCTRVYIWHISNFYIIPSMNRNLMNGIF